MNNRKRTPVAVATAMALATIAASHAQTAPPPSAVSAETPVRSLGVVTVTGGRPSSLPSQIPTTMESITGEEVQRSVNATDSEDALKYFPSLLVRKRYIGDYNHAILSSRASGTGNPARSAVYADGMLLSNYLGNSVSGLSYPPRWGMVTPEEIERVDVMYGPFSAAYPGNSAGAVVDFVTRMPTRMEAHAKIGFVSQPFDLYGTHRTFGAWQSSASLGNKAGDWSWWFNVNHLVSKGQPLTFATRLLANGVAGGGGTPVTGAVSSLSTTNAPQVDVASGTQYDTVQDHAKVKLAYDISATLRASYVLGLWQNRADGNSASYLSDAAGQPVTSGAFSVNGLAFTGAQALSGADFPTTRESLLHVMHGFSLKSHTQSTWDWEISASLYDYSRDQKRQNAASNSLPGALLGGAGTLADGAGSGWNSLDARGTWRPEGMSGRHIWDFGVQQASYQLQYTTFNVSGNYLSDGAGSVASDVRGKTRLQSLWAQDSWRIAQDWKTVLGLRGESWRAFDGRTAFSATSAINQPSRRETFLSPKVALSWQWKPDTVLKASLGRAVRMPTVFELYGATSTTNSQFINDPNLKPERSWTAELSAERNFGNALGRLTFFAEDTRDALYSQTVFDNTALRNISRVQNVGRIATQGLEAAYNGSDVLMRGLDVSGSLTYAQSVIKENAGFVSVPGDTIGKQQPNIPRWRATLLVSYRFNEEWSASVGARYSGRQFRTLDNSDVNGTTYFGVSPYFTADLRVLWRIGKGYSAAFGIDNLNNYQYWNFHPYPQRSYSAELRWDL